jgi:uncharacterized protein (TIGR02246 family)
MRGSVSLTRRDALFGAAAVAVASAAMAQSNSQVDDVKKAIAEQAKLWTAGDIDGFCSYYTDDAVFVSPSGLTEGRKAVLDRYKKKYGTTKEGMGALSLDILHAIADGEIASVAMRWTLTFKDKPAATGFSVIGLVKRDKKWLIAHDASM